MGKENEWIEDEKEALKRGFEDARDSGKLFNINTWKRKREARRLEIKLKKMAGF